MMSKKEMLANLIFSNNLFENIRMLWTHKNLSVLAFHRIVPLPADDYPYVKGVISCDVETFNRQLEFVKKHFNVINFRDIRKIHQANEEIPPDSLILTFDDGYADNFTNMLPVLESHGMTAVVFLATYYIDTGELFWVDKLAYTVNRMKARKLEFLGGRYIFEINDDNREKVRQNVGRLCASVSFGEHLQIMRELDDQVGIRPSNDEYELARPMTWDEVRSLQKSGVEIGAHTVMHGFLDRMSSEEIERELQESKDTIDRQLGSQAITICYPAGKYTEEVLRISGKCGYEYGCSYLHSTAIYSPELRFRIPRIHVDYDIMFPLFKANLMLPRVFLR